MSRRWLTCLISLGLAASLAGWSSHASAAAETVQKGQEESSTDPDESDSDGSFSRDVIGDDSGGDGQDGSGSEEEGSGSGTDDTAPVHVPCTWFRPNAVPAIADILNRVHVGIEEAEDLPNHVSVDLDYYVENSSLRRWNGQRSRFEQHELADCSRAQNEPTVTTGDTRWIGVVPPSPGTLIPALRLVVSGQIQPPESQISPTDAAPVNLGLWFAVTNPGPIVAEGRLGPLWARGTATLTTTTFDPGNGDRPLTCGGGGTAITDLDTVEQGPCGYTYRSLDDVYNDDLQITIDSSWTIVWETSDGNATADPGETMIRTTVIPYNVYEIQTVGTGG